MADLALHEVVAKRLSDKDPQLAQSQFLGFAEDFTVSSAGGHQFFAVLTVRLASWVKAEGLENVIAKKVAATAKSRSVRYLLHI